MRYNMTYRAKRRIAARKLRKELARSGRPNLAEFWSYSPLNYFKGKRYRDDSAERKARKSKTY